MLFWKKTATLFSGSSVSSNSRQHALCSWRYIELQPVVILLFFFLGRNNICHAILSNAPARLLCDWRSCSCLHPFKTIIVALALSNNVSICLSSCSSPIVLNLARVTLSRDVCQSRHMCSTSNGPSPFACVTLTETEKFSFTKQLIGHGNFQFSLNGAPALVLACPDSMPGSDCKFWIAAPNRC